MNQLTGALASGPSDPFLLALTVVAVWMPLCAIGLASLAMFTVVQEKLALRRPRRPSVVVPPPTLRPVTLRRYLTANPRGAGTLGLARVAVAVLAVAGLSAAALVTSGGELLSALPISG